ncbi:GTP-binding protein [Lutimonas sp.]|uniref:GTP-binding protein n=1 Tax=Lutimonas sp. TaxID=1872403 RepID=UPI003D9AF7BD
MNDPIHNDELNRILLKPRFKLKYSASVEEILDEFRGNLAIEDCKYKSKIVNHHIVIDVPLDEEHFWSPQLHVEVEKEDEVTVVKGILGPKPKIWTMFMFLHFIVALAFFIFFVIFYSKWSLDQDYQFSMIMFLLMPVLWFVLYFIGQLGKKIGYEQMVGLHNFLIKALGNFKSIND